MGVSKNRGYPQNGWFIMENPIKIDDLGVPLLKKKQVASNLWAVLWKILLSQQLYQKIPCMLCYIHLYTWIYVDF